MIFGIMIHNYKYENIYIHYLKLKNKLKHFTFIVINYS